MNEFENNVLVKLAVLQNDVKYIKEHYTSCNKIGKEQFNEFKSKFWWIVGIYGTMLGTIFALIMIK